MCWDKRMAVVALANIRLGLNSYTAGEVLDSLTEPEEHRLIELGYAAAAPMGAAVIQQ
jgi:hypothetical protein